MKSLSPPCVCIIQKTPFGIGLNSFGLENKYEKFNPIPGGFHHRIPWGYGKFASPNFSMK